MKNYSKDILILILLTLLAFFVCIGFNVNFLFTILLFFILPSCYLIFRKKKIFRTSLIFAVIFGTAFYLVLDPLAAANNAWLIERTIFPKLNGVTIENYFYALGWTLFVTLFYNYFIRGQQSKISKNIKIFIYIFSFLSAIVLFLFIVNQSVLYVPYFYFVAGTIFAFVPLVLFVYKYPGFLKSVFPLAVYFFFVLLLFEIVGLKNNLWNFPGSEFIGFTNIFGYVFPQEELIFWIILASPGLVTYYEFFAVGKLPKN